MPVVEVSLPDGAPVRVRLGTPDDGDELLAGFEQLSDESRYYRFFTAKPRLTFRLFEQLTDVDAEEHIAIAAFDPARPSTTGTADGTGIAVVRVIRDTEDPTVAEFAVAVIDPYHGRGVGTLLMQAAISVACQLGVQRLVGSILADNKAMLALAEAVGAEQLPPDQLDLAVRQVELDVVELEAELPPDRRAAFRRLLPVVG